MPALIADFVKTSQYIVCNNKGPVEKSLPYAVCLAYANSKWKQDTYKNLKKWAIAQEKMVNKLLNAVDSLKECFQRNFDAVDQALCPDLNRLGYNSVLKYLDIYAALWIAMFTSW